MRKSIKKIVSIFLAALILISAIYIGNTYYNYHFREYFHDSNNKNSTSKNSDAASETKMTDTPIYDKYTALLSEEKKAAYSAIYSAMKSHRQTVTLNHTLKSQQVFDIVNMVICFNPEIFWADGNCSYSESGILTIEYTHTKDEAEKNEKAIRDKISSIFNQIAAGDDDFEKSLALFDYIVLNTQYDYSAAQNIKENPRASTIEGVFLDGKAICSGYAKAYQYLLKLAGIDALYVYGDAAVEDKMQSHAWVLQQIENEFYFTDPTWGDSFEDNAGNFSSHIYFCINQNDISKTHTLEAEKFDFISCNNSDNSYFKRKGLLIEEYNPAIIKSTLKSDFDAINSGNANPGGIELKFTNNEQYQKAYKKLFDDGELYTIILSVDLFSKYIDCSNTKYSLDDINNVITIFYEK